MEPEELTRLKEELGLINVRLDGVEGHFDSFDRTLSNHMNDYDKKLSAMRTFISWTSGVQIALVGIAISSVIGTLLFMLKMLMERGG